MNTEATPSSARITRVIGLLGLVVILCSAGFMVYGGFRIQAKLKTLEDHAPSGNPGLFIVVLGVCTFLFALVGLARVIFHLRREQDAKGHEIK